MMVRQSYASGAPKVDEHTSWSSMAGVNGLDSTFSTPGSHAGSTDSLLIYKARYFFGGLRYNAAAHAQLVQKQAI